MTRWLAWPSPLLGLGLGAAMAGAAWLGLRAWPPEVAAGIAILLGLLVGRARAEAGFARLCDAFGATRRRERALAILADGRLGAFGAVGLALLLGLRWQAIAALPLALLPAALLAAQAASRGAARALAMLTPPIEAPPPPRDPLRLALEAAACLAPVALLPAAGWLLVPGVAALVALGAIAWVPRRLGGHTEAGLAATQQVGEVAVLLALLALA